MAVNLSPVGGVAAQFFTNTGAVLTGGKLYTYLAGTTTPAAAYTSSNGSTAWTNPIVLDAAGRVPGSGEIWITDGILYKFLLKDANDVLIATYDNINGINSNFVAFTNQQEIVTATAGQTVFNLGISYQPGTNSLSVFVDGVNQYGPGAQYAYLETDQDTVTFLSGLHVGASVKFTTSQLNSASIGAASVSYDAPFSGSVTTNVEEKLSESVSVKDFGAVGDGVTNDTTAFTNARAASSGKYYIPEGVYLVNSSPDVWVDSFTASGNSSIKISATTYNVSNAFAGRLRYRVASNVLTWITDAVTGNDIIGIQNSQPGTATYFKRGLAFTTDSHFIQCQPATNGGSTDLLFQRSTLNADPGGNRFNTTFEESNDRLLNSYATTASGAPNFDTYMSISAGTSPSLSFPALSAMFNQGWKTQTRAGGALKLSFQPNAATTAQLLDETSSNVLQKVNRSRIDIAGVALDTLFDTPSGVTQPRMWGGVYSDIGTDANGTLPVTKNLWSTTGATNNQVIGTLIIAATTSGGTLGYRESRFVFDGTTVTLTDLVNTLPAQVTATVAVSGTNLQFQASYAGGLGGGCTVTAMCNWCGAGR
jgi:hypothetical protein